MSQSAHPPSVSAVLSSASGQVIVAAHGHAAAVLAIRSAIEEARRGQKLLTDADSVGERALVLLLAALRPRYRPVWNLTGTILHTNLGRAVLGEAAVEAATTAMRRPLALEYDVGTGQRGERDAVVAELVCSLCDAQGAVLVNNNAAAVMLVLDTLARGGEVIVSRGELVEIGGSFRLPDILERTGARLREVGTTNRTHLRDYAQAIGPETRMILKVHPSNFSIVGFTKAVGIAELAPLAREHGLPLVHDLGSGSLVDIGRFGLPKEPTVGEAVREGADIVTFSGDKLLGGPQAGFAVGQAELIAAIARNPLKRALRLDKIRLAALEATLQHYKYADPVESNPTLQLLARPPEDILAAAKRLAPAVARILGETIAVEVCDNLSQVGSGASPTAGLPSTALCLAPASTAHMTPEKLAASLRELPEPVIGRIRTGRVLLDLRCLLPEDEAAFLTNLSALTRPEKGR